MIPVKYSIKSIIQPNDIVEVIKKPQSNGFTKVKYINFEYTEFIGYINYKYLHPIDPRDPIYINIILDRIVPYYKFKTSEAKLELATCDADKEKCIANKETCDKDLEETRKAFDKYKEDWAGRRPVLTDPGTWYADWG